MTKRYIALLLLIVLSAMVVAGCTTTSPAATPATGTTAQPTAQAPANSGIQYATVWPTATGVLTGTGDLHGTITKEGSDPVVPLQNAVIYIWKAADADNKDSVPAFAKAVTDANGQYKISNIPAGSYKIRVTAPNNLGYHDSDVLDINGPTEWNNAE